MTHSKLFFTVNANLLANILYNIAPPIASKTVFVTVKYLLPLDFKICNN